MRETTLATLNPAGFAAAFNLVYQDYLVPFVVDAAWAPRHIAGNDLDLAQSPLWLDDAGQVVGLAALGCRDARGWVGGFGVAPDYRGKGLAQGLILALLEAARQRGLSEVQLEVIKGNTRAVRTYERAGFAHIREVRIFAHPADSATSQDAPAQLHAVTPAELLPHATRLRPVRPTWQRETASLAHTPNLAGLALGSAAAPTAYVLYAANDTNASIVDFAAPTAELAQTLAAALPAHLPGRTLRLSNEPEESPVCAALDHLGWQETLREHEMIYTL